MRNVDIPNATSRRAWAAVLFVCLTVGLAAGCSADPIDDGPTTCTVDTDCNSGQYCTSSSVCRRDCSPSEGSECPTGQSCTSRGQCVPRNCEMDEGCPEGFYCSETGCMRDCGSGVDAECGENRTCTDRGQCVSAVEGECETDADCDDPPAGECGDDGLVEYAPSGTCETTDGETQCVYNSDVTDCPHGCSDGACEGNPCEGKTCDTPPEAECTGQDGEEVLTTYRPDGSCDPDEGGTCQYTAFEKSCEFGCDDGACHDGPCDTVTCEDPPDDKCDGDTAVQYTDTGTCHEGNCDYDVSFEHCGYTKAECTDAQCQGGITQSDQMVVTEYMADPEGDRDRSGEWIELKNTSGSEIDLKGWTLESAGNSAHTIDESVTVADSDYVLLALTSDPAGDGSVTPDYVYDNIRLANGGDWIQVNAPNGDAADYVFYEAGAAISGRSRKLDSAANTTAAANDDFANWCPSLSDAEKYGDGSDRGSPGQQNPACNPMPCSQHTCEKPTAFCKSGDAVRPTKDQASCTASRFNNPNCDYGVKTFNCTSDELCVTGQCESVPQNVPAQGDVIITELMGNPDAVGDTNGEWIEVYNTTSSRVSLFSLLVEDNEMGNARDSYQIADTGAEVPAEGFAVLAVATDKTKNGGIDGAYHYRGSHLKNSPGPNLEIRIALRDGTVVDSVPYRAPTAGASQQLDKSIYESGSDPASANDDIANWCDSASTYGDGDRGTPGADNTNCQ